MYEGMRNDVHIGEALRLIRKSADMTQSEVAERADISRERISRIENGRHSTNIALLARIFYTLGYSIDITPLPAYHEEPSRSPYPKG